MYTSMCVGVEMIETAYEDQRLSHGDEDLIRTATKSSAFLLFRGAIRIGGLGG